MTLLSGAYTITAYYVRYVKLVSVFIRQVSLCDALPLFHICTL